MKLADAIDGVPVKSVSGTLDIDVNRVCYDSREVSPGDVFCALKGVGVDGNKFVENAIENGAVAIVSDQPYPADAITTWVHVHDARAAMGQMAANIEGHPSGEFPVVGITGTNGKTTTTYLVHHIMTAILRRAGLIGTIQYSTGDEIVEAPHTTPEAPDLQRLLREMRDADCRGVAMEVSSHGLAQHRAKGTSFDVGVFTNLSQDHLDYHVDMEGYFASKRILFEQMDGDRSKEGAALINIDDIWGDRLLKTPFSRIKKYTFGQSPKADFRASDIKADFNGTRFKLTFKDREMLVRVPLIGSFNVYNSVAAIASAYLIGLNLREVVARMAEAPQVPGRLEAVGDRQTNYRVFVDYAHTPDALVNVLNVLRALEPNRIITVFGCGGDRDSSKRAPMAAAAQKGSDYCVLTSDNPRTEDPTKIIEDAAEGFTRSDFEIEEDRKAAIQKAILMAEEKDIVLIAGKGHEPYQEINGVRHDFDDRRVAKSFVNQKAERGSA